MATLILTGDVNLMNVDDPAVPFARVRDAFRDADLVFSNLECCLYQPPGGHSFHNEGFFADPAIGGEALRMAGIAAVGIANNVNYGEAAILASIARLDAIGMPHTGAGANLAAARAPVLLQRGGLRFGFLQRSSVYWPTNHEAGPHDPGIAVIRGHTAYQVPMHKTRPEIPPMNRPGIPPVDRHLGRCGLSARLHRRHRRVARAGRYRGRLMPLGSAQGRAGLYARYRPCRDRRRRRHRDRARPALLAAGRGVSRQADLLRAGQFLVPYRPWRAAARRLDRHDGDARNSTARGWRRPVSASSVTTTATKRCRARWRPSRRNSRIFGRGARRSGRG